MFNNIYNSNSNIYILIFFLFYTCYNMYVLGAKYGFAQSRDCAPSSFSGLLLNERQKAARWWYAVEVPRSQPTEFDCAIRANGLYKPVS